MCTQLFTLSMGTTHSQTIANAVSNYDTETFKNVMKTVSEEERIQLLMERNAGGYTPISQALNDGKEDIIRCIIEHVNSEQLYSLLSITNNWGNTGVHLAAFRGYNITLKLTVDPLKSSDLYKLLMIRNKSGHTAMHSVAYSNDMEMISCLLDQMSPRQQLELLLVENEVGQTPLDRAKKFEKNKSIICIEKYLERATAATNRGEQALAAIDRGEGPTQGGRTEVDKSVQVMEWNQNSIALEHSVNKFTKENGMCGAVAVATPKEGNELDDPWKTIAFLQGQLKITEDRLSSTKRQLDMANQRRDVYDSHPYSTISTPPTTLRIDDSLGCDSLSLCFPDFVDPDDWDSQGLHEPNPTGGDYDPPQPLSINRN